MSGPYGDLELAIRYGQSLGADQDFILVYRTRPPTGMVMLGGADIIALSRAQAMRAATLWDPLITQPLLGGQVLVQRGGALEQLLDQFRVRPRRGARKQIFLARVLQALQRAEEAAASDYPESLKTRFFWSSLSFALTYWICAGDRDLRYSRPAILESVVRSAPRDVRSMYRLIVAAKRRGKAPSLTVLQALRECIAKGGGG